MSFDNGRVREWIGPRIVPVFADVVEWDIDSTYEPLVMVQHEGETFMTRQYVPAGIQLPNTAGEKESNDYWVHMSNWNAQVEYYRQEVLAFDGRIDNLEDALPIADFDSTHTVDGRFDTIEADSWVTSARINDGAVTTAKIEDANVTSAKIASEAVTKTKLAKKKMIIFGDSFSAGESNTKWMQFFTRLHPEVEIHNYSAGGASIVLNLDSQIDQAVADSSFENSDISYVLIFMGLNDRGQGNSLATVTPYLMSGIQKIRNNFTTSDVQYVFNTSTPIYEAMYELGCGLVDAAVVQQGIKACTMFGWLYPDNYGSDFVHPDTYGYARIASNINALYCGGDLHFVSYRCHCDMTNYTNCTAPDDKNVWFYIHHLNDRDFDMIVQCPGGMPTGASNSASFETPDVNTFGLGIIVERFLGWPTLYANGSTINQLECALRGTQHLVTLSPQDFRFKIEGRISRNESSPGIFFNTFSRFTEHNSTD